MDKNETLLDYAKDNMDNNEEKDARVASLEQQRNEAESRISQGLTQIETLEKELQSKNSLIEQVKKNLEEMRAEKITTQAHMATLENEKADMQKRAHDARLRSDEEMKRLEA